MKENKLGLSEENWNFFYLNLVIPMRKHDCSVWAFGSRAKGTHRKFSDLDILYECKRPLPSGFIYKLKVFFEESNFPIKIDLVDIKEIAMSYKQNILGQRVEL